ncbi:MAG TPA: PQQ-dependent sugar dehydrogenase [Saprospiraceae bacterium]|nr:PQQ-dependent sugar dehydrogenase [Saprospiraceae bacterium]
MRKLTVLAGLLALSSFLYSQTNILPEIVLEPFIDGLDNPVGIEHAGDSRLFVLEQPGRVLLYNNSGELVSIFLDITDRVYAEGFEQGLLGIAFDPNYATNGYFYVHYTNLEENNQFSRFSVNPGDDNHAIPGSEIMFLEDDDPFENHNSGQMKFGPDSMLYFTLGDGGDAGDPMNNAQNMGTIMGKLLRIDPNPNGTYSIPFDNPFAEEPNSRGEIWASGLRNPWRFSFDRLTGELWIPDVGQDNWEEVNIQPAESLGGENYGWSCNEGSYFFKSDCDDNGIEFTDPIAEYAHSTDTSLLCAGSITGGYVYRGSIYPNMFGKYIYNDFCTGVMRTTYWNGSSYVTAELGQYIPFAYSTFGEDINGELLLADKISGVIYKVTDQSTTAIEEASLMEGRFFLTPSPNDGNYGIRFYTQFPQDYVINLYDYTGRKVREDKRESISGYNEWDFTNPGLNTGQYFIQLKSETGSTVLSFMTR